MGIHRLTRFCHDHSASREATELKSGDLIVVDGSSLVFQAAVFALRDLVSEVPTLHFLGGEFRSLNDFLTSLITGLNARGITLRVIFDPAVGGESEEDWQRKLRVWEDRFQEQYAHVKALEAYCDRVAGSIDPQVFVHGALVTQVIDTLRRLGVSASVADNEADVHMVQEMLAHNGVAIASNDSDFAAIPGSRWLSLDDLLSLQSAPADAPLTVQIVTPAAVSRALEIPEARLPEVTALCGTDATKPILIAVCRVLLLFWFGLLCG
jgi:hypothetical protein